MKPASVLSGALFSALLALPFSALAVSACIPRPVGLAYCPQPQDKILPDVKAMLAWNPPQRLIGFRNDYRSYPGDVVKAGNHPLVLPVQRRSLKNIHYQIDGQRYSLQQYLKRQNVQGFLLLKDGKIIDEYYANGNTRSTLWTSRSVAKSIVSTLVGIAIKQGKIAGLDDLIVRYEPELKGTVWDGITLRQLIQHTSGVAWNENYADPHSDFAMLTQCEAHPQTYECVRKLVTGVKSVPGVLPGDLWSYNTGGAWLLGDVLERATGMPLAQYLQQQIWQPAGMAQDAVWHAYQPGRHDMGGHGFNATLRDWGRFGLFIQHNGVLPDGRHLLPDNWLNAASDWVKARNSISAGWPEGHYGYQWWNNSVPRDRLNVAPRGDAQSEQTLWALGIYGQMIAVNRQARLVMVQWSTWPQAEPAADSTLELEPALLFNALLAMPEEGKR